MTYTAIYCGCAAGATAAVTDLVTTTPISAVAASASATIPTTNTCRMRRSSAATAGECAGCRAASRQGVLSTCSVRCVDVAHGAESIGARLTSTGVTRRGPVVRTRAASRRNVGQCGANNGAALAPVAIVREGACTSLSRVSMARETAGIATVDTLVSCAAVLAADITLSSNDSCAGSGAVAVVSIAGADCFARSFRISRKQEVQRQVGLRRTQQEGIVTSHCMQKPDQSMGGAPDTAHDTQRQQSRQPRSHPQHCRLGATPCHN